MLKRLRLLTAGCLLGMWVTTEWLVGEAELRLFHEIDHHRKGARA